MPFITSIVSKEFHLLGAHMGHPRHHFKTRRKNEDREKQLSKKSLVCGEEREVFFVGEERKKNLSLTVRMGKGGGGDCSILAHFASSPPQKKEKK